ncbi:tandem-95 repeat protein, partial [Alteriqipengyuania sp. WL0013]|uniref:beta strand repeat-containing protein n=1 Tax=Alteriqipengyuania sp. WL0013 TaxID=3110773 RepID=UPI002C8D90E0
MSNSDDFGLRGQFEGSDAGDSAHVPDSALAAESAGSDANMSMAAMAQAGGVILRPDANNVVVLPAGASLEDIRVEGRDLVIELADGRRFVIPDGAIDVPQVVIGDVAVPPLNLAALLIDNEPQPAAGNPQSSGGNFARDVDPLQDAFDLGNLLPYTDFTDTLEPDEEVIPYPVDREPDVIVISEDNPAGAPDASATVEESGLAERDGEPEGTEEAGDGELTSGTIEFSAADGVDVVFINGVEVTFVGQQFVGDYGILTITSIAPGVLGYTYEQTDNTLGDNAFDEFDVTVRDTDGDTATGSLTIRILDDAPIAADDTNTADEDTGIATGNVLTGDPASPGDVADQVGADDASLTSVTGAGGTDTTFDEDGNLEVAGQYGTLVIDGQGNYTYTANPEAPSDAVDVFTYVLTDADGSTSEATLTITVPFNPEPLFGEPANLELDEDGLEGANADDGQADPQETAGTGSASASGSVAVEFGSDLPADLAASIVLLDSPALDGQLTTLAGDPVVFALESGALVGRDGSGGEVLRIELTGFATAEDGTVTANYTATLSQGVADAATGAEGLVSLDGITLQATDNSGDVATTSFSVSVRDDVPTATDDGTYAVAEDTRLDGIDAFANDAAGADGVDLAAGIAIASQAAKGKVIYNDDGTFSFIPDAGAEGADSFTYTITDGDGDVATATVNLLIAPDSTPQIAVAGDNDVTEAGLPARGTEPEGTAAATDGEIANGSIPVTTGNDTVASLVINGVDVTAGGTVTTAKGTLLVSVDAAGAYSYSYTLADNTLSDPDSDTFTLTVTDSDGDTAATTLVIAIVDDAPSAENDANAIDAGEYGPVGGNVLANDTQGADGAVVTSYSNPATGSDGVAGQTIEGEYGTLTIAPGGIYSYTRNADSEGGVTETFTYTITDGDGDTATAQLIIEIADSPVELFVPQVEEPGTIVFEEGLPARPGESEGTDAASDSETTQGTITYDAADGPATITIGGVAVAAVGQTFAGGEGTLTITSIAEGVIGYSYTLADNTFGDATSDSFAIVVTDQDGDSDSGTLVIAIVDDAPAASDDGTYNVAEDTALVISDALDNDLFGADGVDLATGVAVASQGAKGSVVYNGDGTFTYTPDAGAEGSDSFTYTITDGDGDPSTATVTVTIAP